MNEPLSRGEWWRWLISGILLAVLAIAAGLYTHHEDTAQMNTLIATDQDTNKQVHALMTAQQAGREAAAIDPATAALALKKQALDLGSILMGRATESLALMGASDRYQQPAPPGSARWEANEREDAAIIATQQKGRDELDQLVTEYKTTYAQQAEQVRKRFVALGQTDWKHDNSYYLTADQGGQISEIGQELIRHANRIAE